MARPNAAPHEDGIRFAEELVREFLLFRGFTSTLRSFDFELSSDHARAFSVDRILDLIFSTYIPQFEADKILSLLDFLKRTFFSPQDARHVLSLAKFETFLKRYYLVHAIQKGRVNKVLEFFQHHGQGLLQSGDDNWDVWFALPYMKNPQSDSRLAVYFSKEWLDTFVVSFRNFLNEVFGGIHILMFFFPFLWTIFYRGLGSLISLPGQITNTSSSER